MNCPKCNKKMIDGYVPSNTMRLQFIPEANGKMPKTIFTLGKNAVPLSKMPSLLAAKAKAYYCSTCRIVVTPELFEETESDVEESAEPESE